MEHICKHPRHIEATKTQNELAQALGKLQAKIAELEARLSEYSSSEDTEDSRVAAAMEFAKDGVVRNPESIDSLREQHVVLRQQADATAKALRANHSTFEAITSELSAEVCRDLNQEHQERVGKKRDAALKDLLEAFDDERKFISEIESQGYSAGYLRHHYGMPHIEDVLRQHHAR